MLTKLVAIGILFKVVLIVAVAWWCFETVRIECEDKTFSRCAGDMVREMREDFKRGYYGE